MVLVSNRLIKFFQFILRMEIDALAFFPFIIVRTTTDVSEKLLIHEHIHLRQQLEMLIIPFYIVYLYEFYTKGYHNVSFEIEAYDNEHDKQYLKKRKLYSSFKYYKFK